MGLAQDAEYGLIKLVPRFHPTLCGEVIGAKNSNPHTMDVVVVVVRDMLAVSAIDLFRFCQQGVGDAAMDA